MKNLFSKLFGRESKKQKTEKLRFKTSPKSIKNQQEEKNLVETETKEKEIDLSEILTDACKLGDAEKVNWVFSTVSGSKKPDLTKIMLPKRDGKIVPLLNWIMNKLAFEDTKSDTYLVIAKTLVANGADFAWGNKASYINTPIEDAVYYGYADLVKLMFEKGAKLKSDQYYQPLINVALDKNHLDIAKLLVENDDDVNSKLDNGDTILHLAISKFAFDIISILIAKGADVNLTDSKGETPLSIAVRNSDIKTVELLLRNNANPDIKENYGKPAIYYAKKQGQKDILNLLGLNEDDTINQFIEEIEEIVKVLINRKEYDPWDREDYESKNIVQELASKLTGLRLEENPKLLDKLKGIFRSEPWIFNHPFSYVAWDDMGCKYKTSVSIYNKLNNIDSDYCAWLLNEFK